MATAVLIGNPESGIKVQAQAHVCVRVCVCRRDQAVTRQVIRGD